MTDDNVKPWDEFFGIGPKDKRKSNKGTAIYYLHLESVGQIYQRFCEYSIKYYNLDPRTKPKLMDRLILSQVHSFSKRYGIEDSLHIIDRVFSPARRGLYKGSLVGVGIFTRSYSFYADQLLFER